MTDTHRRSTGIVRASGLCELEQSLLARGREDDRATDVLLRFWGFHLLAVVMCHIEDPEEANISAMIIWRDKVVPAIRAGMCCTRGASFQTWVRPVVDQFFSDKWRELAAAADCLMTAGRGAKYEDVVERYGYYTEDGDVTLLPLTIQA